MRTIRDVLYEQRMAVLHVLLIICVLALPTIVVLTPLTAGLPVWAREAARVGILLIGITLPNVLLSRIRCPRCDISFGNYTFAKPTRFRRAIDFCPGCGVSLDAPHDQSPPS